MVRLRATDGATGFLGWFSIEPPVQRTALARAVDEVISWSPAIVLLAVGLAAAVAAGMAGPLGLAVAAVLTAASRAAAAVRRGGRGGAGAGADRAPAPPTTDLAAGLERELWERGDELLQRDAQLQAGQVEPRQRWMPRPNAAWRFSARSSTTRSASGNTEGSRLAAGNGSSTQSLAFIGQPWNSWSSATRRAIVTGA